jgi:alpha-beta hydrolase superfamily lysophospholipase
MILSFLNIYLQNYLSISLTRNEQSGMITGNQISPDIKEDIPSMRLATVVREPATRSHTTPLLFVHGAWHGAWCWEEFFLPYFAQHGYVACALDLRGHGKSGERERLRWMSIANYVSDLAEVARQMENPPAVIGHSMGGLVVQKYLESHQAPAGVLLASVPPGGVLRLTLSIARRHPLRFLQANLTLGLYPIVATPQLTREAFFSANMPEEQLKTYYAHIQNESFRAYLDMLALNLPRPQKIKIPMLVLGAEKDTIFTRKEVAATARAYATQAQIFPNMAHDMMLEKDWEAVARCILEWLDSQGI